MPGNFKNPVAVQEVLSGKRTVANAAWWGFDSNDSTFVLQEAIKSGVDKVIIPYMGSDWIVQPIKLVSNQEIVFAPGVVVIAKKGAFKGKGDCLFRGRRVENVKFLGYGASLKMRRKDYTTKKYQKSEWRMGISLRGCKNIGIYGLKISDTGGDGIYMRDIEKNHCKDIIIKDCDLDNNFRQGLSIISVENALIENCIFQNTNGASPSAGIDIEPNDETNILQNIEIINCSFLNNNGPGIQVYLKQLSSQSKRISIKFANNLILGSKSSGFLFSSNGDDCPDGIVEFDSCSFSKTDAPGVYFKNKSANKILLSFQNCSWRDICRRNILAPVYFDIDIPSDKIKKAGNIAFKNCHFYEKKGRTVFAMSKDDFILAKIDGQINVFSDNIYNNKVVNLPRCDGSVKLKITMKDYNSN